IPPTILPVAMRLDEGDNHAQPLRPDHHSRRIKGEPYARQRIRRQKRTQDSFWLHRIKAGGAGSDESISVSSQQQPTATYMPPPEAFCPAVCDVHTAVAGPTPGPSRLQLVSILLTGDYFEGQRQKIEAGQGVHACRSIRSDR